MYKKFILFFVFLIASQLVNAAKKEVVVYVNPKQSIFSVTLPTNPSTGYVWSISSFDKYKFQLIRSRYISPTSTLMGAPGKRKYSFKLNRGQTYPESTKMVFKYSRPFEKDGGSETLVKFIFSAPKT